MKRETAILIPHYNNFSGLEKSLKSIKSKISVDLVIVDDGSDKLNTPSKSELAKSINDLDCEIHLIYLNKNCGVERALNEGIKFILNKLKSKYIFRIDSGDICLNNRLDIQVNFLDKNDNICLVGSWVRYVNQRSEKLFVLRLPLTHDQIKKRMYVRVPFIHSAVLFRTAALNGVGYYSTEYKAAEDYAFFIKFIKTCRTANIPEVLTQVEWNPTGISSSKRVVQLKSRLKLLLNNPKLNFYFFYGVFRVVLLMLIPYSIIEAIKKKLY